MKIFIWTLVIGGMLIGLGLWAEVPLFANGSLIVGSLIIGIGLWIGIPTIIRWLGDEGIFWFRLPENYGCFVLKDKKLHKVFIASSDEEKINSIKCLTADTEYDEYFQFITEGLFWIGLPWFGYELHSWYELSKDDDNAEIDPLYILYFGERTWDYTTPENAPEEKKLEFVNEWGVDTADPIQVTPKLVATAEVLHPIKAVFDIKHFQEAILKEILAAWRYAVHNLEYFTYNEDNSSKVAAGASGTLHTEAQKNLNKFLFGEESQEGEISPENYKEGTPARMIYDVYGIWLKRVRIRDIDPTDTKIRDNLQEKLIAQTKAAATVETAKGERDSRVIKADGQVYETTEVGKAEAGVIRMKHIANGEGLEVISKKLDLKPEENKILFAAEMAIKMTENSQYTYLAGMPGDIGTWIMAAADQMKGGLQKVKNETADTQIGFDEIKKAFNGLEPKKQEELLKLAEKTKEGEEAEGREDEEK